MIILTLSLIFLGALFLFYGIWFTFITVANVLMKGNYVPFVLILSSLLCSVGVIIIVLGCKL